MPTILSRMPSILFRVPSILFKVPTMASKGRTKAVPMGRLAQKIDHLEHFIRLFQNKMVPLHFLLRAIILEILAMTKEIKKLQN